MTVEERVGGVEDCFYPCKCIHCKFWKDNFRWEKFNVKEKHTGKCLNEIVVTRIYSYNGHAYINGSDHIITFSDFGCIWGREKEKGKGEEKWIKK